MIYIDSNYSDYKYLVDYGSSYIVVSNRSHISGSSGDPASIPVYVQYFNPSIYGFETTYTSEQYINFSNISNDFSHSIYDRGDFPVIFICGFLILFTFAFILNNLTRLVKKGGLLFSSN